MCLFSAHAYARVYACKCTLVFQHANAGSDGLMTHSHPVSPSLPPLTRAVMDCVSSAFGIYKIETIGDSYMAAGGLFRGSPHEGQEDVCLTVDMAFAMCVRGLCNVRAL